MRPKQDPANKTDHQENSLTSQPEVRRKFADRLKKVGFTVWLAVMVIGGALAFLVALFLV